MAPTEKRVVLVLTCIDAPSVLVSFEPEGAQHQLSADDAFRIEMVGPDDGEPEVSYLPDGIIVGAWARATTRAWNEAGDELKL